MSSDNGMMLVEHPKGGYALVHYFLSSDEPVKATPTHPQYPTFEDAVMDYYSNEAKYETEYGLTISEEIKSRWPPVRS